MGMYIYVTESDVREMSSVKNKELNELLQEARKIDDRILVSEDYYYRMKKGYRGWLLGQKEKAFTYQLYKESRAHDGSTYQARYATCASNYHTVFAYLCGVINSSHINIVHTTELPYSKEKIRDIIYAHQKQNGHEFAAGMDKAFTIMNAKILSKTAK